MRGGGGVAVLLLVWVVQLQREGFRQANRDVALQVVDMLGMTSLAQEKARRNSKATRVVVVARPVVVAVATHDGRWAPAKNLAVAPVASTHSAEIAVAALAIAAVRAKIGGVCAGKRLAVAGMVPASSHWTVPDSMSALVLGALETETVAHFGRAAFSVANFGAIAAQDVVDAAAAVVEGVVAAAAAVTGLVVVPFERFGSAAAAVVVVEVAAVEVVFAIVAEAAAVAVVAGAAPSVVVVVVVVEIAGAAAVANVVGAVALEGVAGIIVVAVVVAAAAAAAYAPLKDVAG